MNWICCQLGAREHYAIPRALHRQKALGRLLTDTWLPPNNPIGWAKRRLRQRFDPELSKANVSAFNLRRAAFELHANLTGLGGWPRIVARNVWFQQMVVSKLSTSVERDTQPTLFAYSYAARDILKRARAKGWRTVLGQIDAGPPEERIVARLYAQDPVQRDAWDRPPPQYWADWQEECSLADRIVVNSSWSQSALIEEGIPAAKIRIVPVAYEGPSEAGEFQREYPASFTAKRPLRVLFLGLVNLRKGVGPLLEAVRLLHGEPVEFWIVGPLQMQVPADLRDHSQVRWVGAVPRGDTDKFYREADVFLFPTFSDGFGMTQLEAQAWKLPIITTNFCGKVVEHGRNGLILTELTDSAIAAALRQCIATPMQLREFADNAVARTRFSVTRIGEKLLRIFEESSS